MKDVVDYDRGRRTDAVDYAHKLQIWHGTIGMLKYTCYGSILVYLANMRFPWMQRQTLAGKAFVVSSFSIFGLVVSADSHLLSHERQQGSVENEVRRRALEDLSEKHGIVASEGQIRRWVMQKKAEAEKEKRERELHPTNQS
ncbi:hypothetical protein E3P99_00120 [Wallemia hederae]|uniref:HIG1 domain-containing protein n=1 Tax=Wallemia hederae TaxID=1540922 RepID=A0A4T0FYF7_9BASI|nr:hypothetical protein E3P99_00120 [Wallemia hederae]